MEQSGWHFPAFSLDWSGEQRQLGPDIALSGVLLEVLAVRSIHIHELSPFVLVLMQNNLRLEENPDPDKSPHV